MKKEKNRLLKYIFSKKSVIKDKRGDLSYTDTAVTTLIIMIVLAAVLNIFSFLTLKQDLEYCCDQLVESAAFDGRIDNEVPKRFEQLCNELGLDPDNITYSFEGTTFFNSDNKKVQYGNIIVITLTYQTTVGGTGIFKIPAKIRCSSSGLSEKYWK